jgi:CubicO group peptidase (beta-lactamase class C family)
MTTKTFLRICSFLSYLLFFSCNSTEKWEPLINDDTQLSKALLDITLEYNQPAMGAALILGDKIIAKSSVGINTTNEGESVNQSSRFHIGSTTKSMTAVLIAVLVEKNKLGWDWTLEKCLPDIPMLDEYKKVTIHDILVNKAGIIPFQRTDLEDPHIVKKLWDEIPLKYPDPVKQRIKMANIVLSLKPFVEPGTKAVYSNAGWALAGLIIDKVSGSPYEKFLQQKIFDPLNMVNAKTGGWPASEKEPLQPRGHFPDEKLPKPQELKDKYTLPEWMNPAGGVHCSILDYALYVKDNLMGLKGKGKILSQEGYQRIHSVQETSSMKDMYIGTNQDVESAFGYGWGLAPVENNYISIADGSGGTFYARMIVYPALNVGFCGFTNCGDGAVALDKIIERITGFEWNSNQ